VAGIGAGIDAGRRGRVVAVTCKQAGFSRSEAGFFWPGLFREILHELFVEFGGN
jgi:hypothetical protein